MKLIVGARESPLSKVQVKEVLEELQAFHPEVQFDLLYVVTTGDKDQKTSLRLLDKTDFFTKEIDLLLLNEMCRIGIHSAKDLPEMIPRGLKIIALTKGVDPSDSLIMREALPEKPMIATSSIRREEMVKTLYPSSTFVDIRGTIEMRLKKLYDGEVDGIVIAESALIRLNLTHLNRIILKGETVPYQGQLAVLSRENDEEMEKLFSCLDCR